MPSALIKENFIFGDFKSRLMSYASDSSTDASSDASSDYGDYATIETSLKQMLENWELTNEESYEDDEDEPEVVEAYPEAGPEERWEEEEDGDYEISSIGDALPEQDEDDQAEQDELPVQYEIRYAFDDIIDHVLDEGSCASSSMAHPINIRQPTHCSANLIRSIQITRSNLNAFIQIP